MTVQYDLDGSKVTTLESFYDQFAEVFGLDHAWGRNLDAMDDILSGGDFGIPESGFTMRWTNSATSQANLGHAEAVRQLENRLGRCHPSNNSKVRADLDNARAGIGPTVFDWLVEIIRGHGDGGDRPGGNVQLVLD